MRDLTRTAPILFTALLLQPAMAQTPPGQGGGGAQPANPTGDVSSDPAQRTYYPTTDYFDPTDLIGSFLYVVKDTKEMGMAAQPLLAKGATVTTKFSSPAPALTYDFSKKDDVNVGVPGIASADYEHSDMVHLELTDVAEIRITGPGVSFCQEWPNFRYVRQGLWKAGDKILYVRHVLTSHASYQTAMKQDANAKVGIGSYFSAGGGEAMATGTQKNVPAMAVNGITVTLSDYMIQHGCTQSNHPAPGGRYMNAKKRLDELGAEPTGIGHIITTPPMQKVKAAKLKL